MEWRILLEEEANRWPWVRDLEGDAWRALFVSLCAQAGGHDWYLTIDPDDGVTLGCRKCPAYTDDVYPDGAGLLAGEFEVCPGYVLGLRYGGVEVNGTDYGGCFTYGWRGPVTVELHTERYYCPDFGACEYDVWIEVTKRDA
jgi:hypothetical protein